jgi:hypothetical protein
MIAFNIAPQPTAQDVERILGHEMIWQTVKKSSPQFGPMAELLSNTPAFRKYSQSLFYEGDYVAALLAMAVEAYLQGRAGQSSLWSILKLHSVEDPSSWLRLSREDRKAITAVVSTRRTWSPIYRWQGENYLEGEQWANCVGVADTRRLIGLILRAWNENWPAPRVKKLDDITDQPMKNDPPRFRDFEVSKLFVRPLTGKVSRFDRPCVFFEWI